MKIYLDCYFYQDNEMMYGASRQFPTSTYLVKSFQEAKEIAPYLGRRFDRIVITKNTRGVNPIPPPPVIESDPS